MSNQDARGWESFKRVGDLGLETTDINICPTCIMEFQACKDIQQNEINTNYLLQERIRKMKVMLQDIIND